MFKVIRRGTEFLSVNETEVAYTFETDTFTSINVFVYEDPKSFSNKHSLVTNAMLSSGFLSVDGLPTSVLHTVEHLHFQSSLPSTYMSKPITKLELLK